MKVSIIVTTKNRPDFLFRCLLSIKLQTFTEFECIVVGDHCEYSESVVKQFDDRFVYYKLSGEQTFNVGATGKNKGIEMSRTNYICYCDDDNLLLPNHIDWLFKGMQVSDLCYSLFYHINYGAASFYEILNRDLYTRSKKFKITIQKKDATCMMHLKKDAIAIGGWRPASEVGYNEDGDFIVRLQDNVQNNFIYHITAIYNAHASNSQTEGDIEYNKLLSELKGVYVYPELVDNLKIKYGQRNRV